MKLSLAFSAGWSCYLLESVYSWSGMGKKRCEIWGILNVTPDSFSDGGEYFDQEVAFRRALQMAKEGADVIDVGGQSSRPAGRTYGEGASEVSEAEEIGRIVPVIGRLARQFRGRISVDTT